MTVKVTEGGESNGETNVAGKVKVGEKEYSAEDVQNLVNQQATATQKTQEVAAVLAAAQKYGVDPETYIAQAEGAFGVMTQLINDKIIDEKGNILQVKAKETPGKTETDGDDELAKLFDLPAVGTQNLKGIDKVAAIVAKALSPQLDALKKLGERVDTVDKTQGDMIRLNLQEKVMDKFPVLKPSDVSQVFGSAMNDRSKSLWEHAEALAGMKTAELNELRKTHAKEFGVDVAKFDENKLKEQEAAGGAGVLFKGKKFSFNARSDDAEKVDPAKAAMEYLERVRSST